MIWTVKLNTIFLIQPSVKQHTTHCPHFSHWAHCAHCAQCAQFMWWQNTCLARITHGGPKAISDANSIFPPFPPALALFLPHYFFFYWFCVLILSSFSSLSDDFSPAGSNMSLHWVAMTCESVMQVTSGTTVTLSVGKWSLEPGRSCTVRWSSLWSSCRRPSPSWPPPSPPSLRAGPSTCHAPPSVDHLLRRYFGVFTFSFIVISIIKPFINFTDITSSIFNPLSRYKNGGEVVEEGSVFTGGRTRTEPSSNVLTVLPRKEVSRGRC